MKHKKYFLFLMLATFLEMAGISCSANSISEPPVASTTLPTAKISVTPSITLSPVPLATWDPNFLTFTPIPIGVPYPTASTVKANSVAFVAQDWQNHGPSSLWIANIDGSGERKIVDNIIELENRSYTSFVAPEWSPNGKWISYISDGDLWMISSDGSISRKIISISDKNNERIYTYKWSPESSQIAYLKGIIETAPQIVVGLMDLATGENSEILSYQSPPPPVTLSWSSDSHYLLLSKYSYFFVLDVTTRKIIKEIKSGGNCPVYHHGVSWSPNNEWFYNIQVGNGRFGTTQICVADLDGTNRQIDIGGTATSYPVWDKTGIFLYFVAANTDFSTTPTLDYGLRLMRYNVRTQKQEQLLSLGKEPRRWSVSISPDGQMLELHTTDSGNQLPFLFVDIQSLSVTKFSVDLGLPVTVQFQTGTAWTSDDKNIILFAGGLITPDGVGVRPYGAFYRLDIRTGQTIVFSGNHNIELGEWVVSPAGTSP